ncbi:hypothetical protein Tco_1392104 [Tanacetum coccineum]
MEAEETSSSEVVHVFSPVVADANHILHIFASTIVSNYEFHALTNRRYSWGGPRRFLKVHTNPIDSDRWFWSLEGSGEFSVASIRRLIDDQRLLTVDSKTLWIKSVPLKVNILAWKIKLEALPTRFNISRRDKLRVKFALGGILHIRTLTPSLNGPTGWPLYAFNLK